MKSITINKFRLKPEVYLNLSCSENRGVIINHKGRLYSIKPLTSPCEYSFDELIDRIEKSEEDIQSGKCFSIEEMSLLLNIQNFQSAKEKLLERIDSIKLIEMLLNFITNLEKANNKPDSLFKDRGKIEAIMKKS